MPGAEGASPVGEEDIDAEFRVLFVCTGNRCRSPVAEAFIRQQAADLPLEVASAGVLELGSVAAPSEMLVAAQRFGLDLSQHRSRALATVSRPYPDLVLGLERAHAAAAVVDAGLPPERVFTLTEIVRLLEEVVPPAEELPVDRARAAVALAHEARGSLSFIPGDEIADPFGGPSDGYVEMTLRVRDLCERLLTGLFGQEASA